MQEVAAAGRATLWCKVSLPSSDWTPGAVGVNIWLTCVRLSSCWSLTGLLSSRLKTLWRTGLSSTRWWLCMTMLLRAQRTWSSARATPSTFWEKVRGRSFTWRWECGLTPPLWFPSLSERGVVGRTLCRRHWHLPQVLRLQGERREPRRRCHITALTRRLSSCSPSKEPPNPL